jgi:hypothetical protein
LKRSEFIIKGLTAVAFGLPLMAVVNSCSTNVEPTPTPPSNDPKDCLTNGTTSSIGSNHGHSLTVSKEDVSAATEKSYSIQGSSGHNHNVTITAANFSDLINNQSIQVSSSSSSGHTHNVSVGCA